MKKIITNPKGIFCITFTVLCRNNKKIKILFDNLFEDKGIRIYNLDDKSFNEPIDVIYIPDYILCLYKIKHNKNIIKRYIGDTMLLYEY